ncbi:ATP-binding protein [Terrimonas rubra]|uniref:ATP-binding protein n=1 Tax=Terrimonas rubra TaxID=1035890 RepID=A0ABW5ZYW5_9BACT
MRIAFTGAHRVGKTSLAEAITTHLPGYLLIQEPYRQLEEQGYLFSEIPIIDDYIAQFNLAVEQTEAAEEKVIFDRCPLDLLPYIHAVSKSRDITSLYADMTNALTQIDLLVFVPVENPDLIPCGESDLPRLRLRVNDIVQEWLSDISIKTIEVNGNLANRQQQVLEALYQFE